MICGHRDLERLNIAILFMLKPRRINWRPIIIVFLIVFILLHVYFFFESSESTENSTRTLDSDGFCCFKINIENREDKDKDERTKTLASLPSDYMFLDYEYVIYSAALSTFHRDVTSSQVLYDCLYPVYTLIVYEYDGDLLSICPASDKSWPFVWSRIVNLSGPRGTCVLFNSEILHAGLTNQCRPRFARQYKICHRDDIKRLGQLQGVRAKKDTECVDDVWSRMKRKISYYFAFLINHVFYPFLMQKWGLNTWMGKMQSLLPDHQFYNNA
jgi:hypothetical protein